MNKDTIIKFMIFIMILKYVDIKDQNYKNILITKTIVIFLKIEKLELINLKLDYYLNIFRPKYLYRYYY